ncbi:MAG: hypothetical protein BWY66_00999 [bacterium ADurb.Bin374]|nr:MAG: hypothetical protein BWY66_00999 [bacterium ADurb.Bin374]
MPSQKGRGSIFPCFGKPNEGEERVVLYIWCNIFDDGPGKTPQMSVWSSRNDIRQPVVAAGDRESDAPWNAGQKQQEIVAKIAARVDSQVEVFVPKSTNRFEQLGPCCNSATRHPRGIEEEHVIDARHERHQIARPVCDQNRHPGIRKRPLESRKHRRTHDKIAQPIRPQNEYSPYRRVIGKSLPP